MHLDPRPIATCLFGILIAAGFAVTAVDAQVVDRPAAIARADSAIATFRDSIGFEAAGSAGVLIAEGDSWFAYPGTNLIRELERFGYAVFSNAENGARLEEMAYSTDRLRDLMDKIVKASLQYDGLPKAIILSAGGNDVVHESLWLMLNHASSGSGPLNQDIVAEHIDVRLEAALRTWIIQVRRLMQNVYGPEADSVPIYVHGYDYAIPDGRGYRLLFKTWRGPWIEPGLLARGYGSLEENPQNARVVRELMGRFNNMLSRVADDLAPTVRYISFLGRLEDSMVDGRYRADWDNELHPTDQAFRRLAAVMDSIIGR